MDGEVTVTWTQVAPSGRVGNDKDSITCPWQYLARATARHPPTPMYRRIFVTNDIYHLLLCKECVVPISLKAFSGDCFFVNIHRKTIGIPIWNTRCVLDPLCDSDGIANNVPKTFFFQDFILWPGFEHSTLYFHIHVVRDTRKFGKLKWNWFPWYWKKGY